MKTSWSIWLVCLFIMTGGIHAEERKHVRADLSGLSEVAVNTFMQLHPDITSYEPEGKGVEVVATPAEIEAMERLGVSIAVLIENLDGYTRSLHKNGYFEHFHTYDQMVEALRAVEVAHPDIAKLHDIGDTWEKTQGLADRDIWAMKISDNVELDEPGEPEVLYMALHHAREIITPEILLSFIHYLMDLYGTDSGVTDIIDHRQLWLVPMVNPDGHAVVLSGTDWRKNTRDNNGNGQFDMIVDGVDLNRNYGYMFGYDNTGSSPDPQSWIYRGPGPFSEPETQAIRDLAEAHHFVISLSYHSYGNWWLYPWGYIPENTPDHSIFVEIADSCVAYNGYIPGNSASGTIYSTNGSTNDWIYGEQRTKCRIFGFTPEVGRKGFYPDTSLILPLIQENLGPNLYVARAAGEFAEPDLSFAGFSLVEIEGDGDGRLEAGETAHLYLRLENWGVGGVSGLTARLETEDPDITLVHAEASFRDMGCATTIENDEDPLGVRVSSDAVPHTVTFTLHVTGMQGTYETDFFISVLLGQETVLLVADDGLVDNQDYYIEALNTLGVPHEVSEIHGAAQSINNRFFDYTEVIWFTGPMDKHTLTPQDRSELAAYLEGGGRLLLSGSLIGYDIGDTPFYREYLQARYVSFPTLLHRLGVAMSNPIIGAKDITLATAGPNGQGFTGEIDPLGTALPILQYDRETGEGPGRILSSGIGALITEAEDYKVAYFSFGLEGVEPLEDRAEILAGVLSWFKYPGVNKGDVDGNGVINMIDVMLAVNFLLGSSQPTPGELAASDMNSDGRIDVLDAIILVNIILRG